MGLILERSATPIYRTHWRAAARITWDGERLTNEQLFQALGDREAVPIKVEDPYRRHRVLGGFVMQQHNWVIAHTSVVDRIADASIGARSIIGPHVRIDPTAVLAEQVELQPGATVGAETRIGQRSTVLKRALMGAGVQLGPMVFVGQNVFIGEGARVGLGSVLAKDAYIAGRQQNKEYPHPAGNSEPLDPGGIVEIGMQAHIHRGVRVSSPTFIADSTEIGEYSRIRRSIIGNNVQIGHYAVIGEGTLIGDDAVIGDMNLIAPSAWLPAGSFIPGRSQMDIDSTPFRRLG